ncbi:flagellar hook-associated protein 3 [bacterium BMS3Bbin06]|nr:flagellar hook-associated protein 3 [bacterium BMS3Abin08]GBE35140.1 flagellar hook-associated protein 3 [bacterium BMS3Bbin06]HDO36462.1 flagellar hook-associated protein 3 [Nitrospirota bacterium]
MRLSTFILHDRLIDAFQDNFLRLFKAQESLATGKKINRPSQDTIGSARALAYRVSISASEQYKRNINEARSYLESIEGVLSNASSIFSRAKEITIGAMNAVKAPEDRAVMAKEVEEMRNGLRDLANTRSQGRYIFSGFLTNTETFDINGIYRGDSNHIEVKTGLDIQVKENLTGEEVFAYSQGNDESVRIENGRYIHYLPGGGTTVNVEIRDTDDTTVLDSFSYDNAVQMLDLLAAALSNNDMGRVNALIKSVDDGHQQILISEAEVGARLGSLDAEQNRLGDSVLDLRTALSETEDADIADVISEIAKTNVALQSLRNISARVLSQSLLDFLG